MGGNGAAIKVTLALSEWQFGTGDMAKITVVEAYANVLGIAQSMASDPERRVSVTKEIDRFSAGEPTAAARARLREKLRLAARRGGMPEETRNILRHTLAHLIGEAA
jgi:hypothetical protein